MRFDFVLDNEQAAEGLDPGLLEAVGRDVAGLLTAHFADRLGNDTEVAVLVASSEEISDLNARFRGLAKPTDVLSFPADEDAGPFLGDIAICPQVIAADAQALSLRLQDHMTHILLHGVLHLLGLDHEAEEDAAEMEGLERTLLAKLGLSDPYASRMML